MLKPLLSVVITTLLLLPLAGRAQYFRGGSPEAKPAGRQMWWQATTDARLRGKWGAVAEVQLRHGVSTQLARQEVLRAGATYTPVRGLQLSAGYLYGRFTAASPKDVAPVRAEHRLYQQVLLTDTKSSLHLQHRLRLEQCWQQLPYLTGAAYATRTRYQLRLTKTLSKNPRLEAGVPYVALANEIFLDLSRRLQPELLVQNRAYAGLGCQTSQYSALEVGYLYQVGQPDGTTASERNHTLQLALSFTPDFHDTTTGR